MLRHLLILTSELKRAIALSAAVLVTAGSLFAFPGFEEAKSEADRGDAQAQAIVATYYALGWQTAKDPALAARYAEQSANAGNPLGNFRLGALLRNGEGVAKDETAGLRLQNNAAGIWSKGFDQGDPFALTAIGVALFQGKVVPQNKAQAAQLYKKAADMDFAPAQYNYAMCAKDGQGIPKNTALCAEYLSKAAGCGYRLAQEALGQPTTAVASNSAADSSELEPQASAGPISGGLDLQFASTSPSTTPPTAPLVANAGPISGSFSLGGESPSASASDAKPASSTKQLTVTGIGVDPAGAEKQAITDAVRQAVGALIDSNTLVQNEEVIRDRILSVSTGFVKKYKPTAPARKRDDGLYEITILAIVATNEVAQKLKENNILSSEVAGQNLWAESSSKVMNAQDGVAMLEAKIPEFIKNSVTITPLSKNGKPQFVKDTTGNDVPNTSPADISEDPVTGKAKLLWIFAIGLDNKYYKEQIVPLLIKSFEAITGFPGIEKEAPISPQEQLLTGDPMTNFALSKKLKELNFKTTRLRGNDYGEIFRGHDIKVIKSISKTLDHCKYIFYKNTVFGGIECLFEYNGAACFLKIELFDSEGELIASNKRACWQPFNWDVTQMITGPMNDGYALPLTLFSEIEMPISLIKEIKQVRVSLDVPDIKILLKADQNQ